MNKKKSELTPQQVFNFVGYRFELLTGWVLPTQERWASLRQKLLCLKTRQTCTVRQFMSFIGPVDSHREASVVRSLRKWVIPLPSSFHPHLDWWLDDGNVDSHREASVVRSLRKWVIPLPSSFHPHLDWWLDDGNVDSHREASVVRSLRKWVIPLPSSFHPHLDWWLDDGNVLRGQPLHSLSHALQLLSDISNEGWGAHLGDSTARGMWSDTESRLHINFLELKAVFLALKSFELLCGDQIVLVATGNTTVVSYINKEGGLKSGSLCALLWRLLSWYHPRRIVLRARHIPGSVHN